MVAASGEGFESLRELCASLLCLCLLPLWRDEDIQYLAFPLSPAETRLPKLESS